jgi:hypothetical protein
MVKQLISNNALVIGWRPAKFQAAFEDGFIEEIMFILAASKKSDQGC